MGANSSSDLKIKAKVAEEIEHGNIKAVEAAVERHRNILFQNREDPWSLLHVACWARQEKIVALLLMEGADPNALNHSTHESPLHYAAKTGNPKICEMLIEGGATPDPKNKMGFTPLHFAAEGNYLQACKILRYYGADVHAKNHLGEEPGNLATQHDVQEVLMSSHVLSPPNTNLQSSPSFSNPTNTNTSHHHQTSSPPMNGGLSPKSMQSVGMLTMIKPEDLHILEAIGSGASGRVFKALWRDTVVAMKQFHPMTEHDFESEVHGISSLGNHPHLVTTYGVIIGHEDQPFCIISEYLELGSLFGMLHVQLRKLSDKEVIQAALGISNGMAFLHGKGIIHRDLKSSNVLVADANLLHMKLCDFGLAKNLNTPGTMTTALGTPQYMAPEVIAGNQYNEKADVYSFGILLWEMIAGKIPYSDSEVPHFQLPVKVTEGYRPHMPAGEHSHDLLKLITYCWDPKPSSRPEFSQISDVLNALAGNNPKQVPESPTNQQGITVVNVE